MIARKLIVPLACMAVWTIVSARTGMLTDERVTVTVDSSSVITGGPLIMPPFLKPGDTVAIVSPAGDARKADFKAMEDVIRDMGFNVTIGRHAACSYGCYAGTDSQRLSDLTEALSDPRIKAVIATRGGYGSVHLLDSVDALPLLHNPKWLVGFSDISALHALMQRHGLTSIHGPMGINMHRRGGDVTVSCKALFNMLRGFPQRYEIDGTPFNRPGKAQGQLTGGNLAVLDALVSTPFDALRPGTILFIEDIGEPVYKIERQLYRLKLSGVLGSLRGLIVGDFTDTPHDAGFTSMERMISDMTSEYDYPVAFGVPAGHGRVNLPLMLGKEITLEVTENKTVITQ